MMPLVSSRPCFFNRVAPLHSALLLTIFILPTVGRAESSALHFVPVTPCRVVDTRNAAGPFGGPALAAASTRTFNIPQGSCGIPTTAVAYSLNATVSPSKHLSWITIWPAGETRPYVSLLNSYDGRIRANAAITQAGTSGGISVYATDATNLILDVDGYFVPAGSSSSALEFFPVAPCRVADTRLSTGPLGGPSLSAGVARSFPVQSSTCGIPSTAQAYSLSVTASPKGPLNYMTVWGSGAQPNSSTLNAPTGAVTANAAIVPAGSGGTVSVFATSASDVIIDVDGYFAPSATNGLSYYPVPLCRSLDTRYGINVDGPFQGTLTIPMSEDAVCATPSAAQAYVLNATVVPTYTLDYLTLWADGTSQPNASTLNSYDGAVTANMAIVPNDYGVLNAYAPESTELIFDLSGYFAP